MTSTTTLEINGAKITVDTSELFRAWFERQLDKPSTSSFAVPAARSGERYLCSIIEPSGQVRHTFLLPGDEEVPSWDSGMAFAKNLGGDLPDRIEQAMFLVHMPEEFKKDAYWSNTQHAGNSYYAWFQNFRYGDQSGHDESRKLRVRAVRREFSNIVI